MVFLNHGGGSFDHIQKSVIFIMIRYLFRLHFHFALSILKMIRRTVPAILIEEMKSYEKCINS